MHDGDVLTSAGVGEHQSDVRCPQPRTISGERCPGQGSFGDGPPNFETISTLA
jgi:hypothetical protein